MKVSKPTAPGGPDVARVLTGLIRDLEQFESLIETERKRLAKERAAARSARLQAGLARVTARAHRALDEIRKAGATRRRPSRRGIAD